ncbi:hypothetical protein HY993_00695 [Candidatus Micrarchaeota archaeon]|nr:hypothetical protein [Candidatus Micrarchaeota archaeon]
MTFELTPSKLFLDQTKQLNEDEKHLIAEKLELAKLNPFRFKPLSVPGLTKVFEIKITLSGLYSRLVYVVEGKQIQVACIINRKNDFRDLMKLLYKARNQ